MNHIRELLNRMTTVVTIHSTCPRNKLEDVLGRIFQYVVAGWTSGKLFALGKATNSGVMVGVCSHKRVYSFTVLLG